MPDTHTALQCNLLLGSLAPSDLALLQPHLIRVPIEREQVLVERDRPIAHVYFLEGGIASVVSVMPDSGRTEVGIFGREGLSGIDVLLGSDRSPNETFMQVDGTFALRIAADDLRQATSQSPSLNALLLSYVQSFLVQLAHCAVANAHSPLEARLARWLLMCHDRVDDDDILLTHEFMSMMISAQRTGVTVTLHNLEGAGMIRSHRGRVTILDRQKLQDTAGNAYGRPEAEYSRLIAPFGRKPH